MIQDFSPGDLIKYRDELPSDHKISGTRDGEAYGEIGIVYEAPLPWDRNDTQGQGVVYINSKMELILAHKKDLILVDDSEYEKLL